MTFKAVIESSKLKQFASTISIYNEKDEFVDGYYLTEIEDKRINQSSIVDKEIKDMKT